VDQGRPQFFADFTSGSTEQILSGWTLVTVGNSAHPRAGHFVAARRYAVDASPPYFLPVPPTLSPIGSLGAFLRLRSVVVDRRQLLDIGAAGPLAGFVVTLAVLVWGYATSQPVPSGEGPHGLIVRFAQGYFVVGESLLLRGLREHYFPGVSSIQLSLPAFAGWAGSFITGLNLLPLSQLDGGHVSYGLVGKRQTVIAWLAVLGLLYLSWHTPAWLIWIVLTCSWGRAVGSPVRLIPGEAGTPEPGGNWVDLPGCSGPDFCTSALSQ
jgi:Zn-dependent protease